MKMATLKNISSVKMLVVGNSGTGKTGALASLVSVLGRRLHLLMFEDKWQILDDLLEKPDEKDRVDVFNFDENEIQTLMANKVPKGEAYRKFLAHIGSGEFRSAIEDPTCVIVIDSLTSFTNVVFNFVHGESGKIEMTQPKIGQAQQLIERIIRFLCGNNVKASVVIIAHFDQEINERTGEITKNPGTAGKKLGPVILSVVNNVVVCESTRKNSEIIRQLSLLPTVGFAPKTQKAKLPKQTFGIHSGLAELFQLLEKS